jgi:hypothetical protein
MTSTPSRGLLLQEFDAHSGLWGTTLGSGVSTRFDMHASSINTIDIQEYTFFTEMLGTGNSFLKAADSRLGSVIPSSSLTSQQYTSVLFSGFREAILIFCRWFDPSLFLNTIYSQGSLRGHSFNSPFIRSLIVILSCSTMYSQQFLLAVLTALSVSALPLNINLGAYSPALVVGDGEISFGGSPERASEVLQTLSSGAQNGAVPNGQAPPAPAAAAETTPARQGEGIQSAAAGTPASTLTPNPEGVSSPLVSTASVEGADANVNAAPSLGDNQLPAEYISHAVANNRFPNMAKEKRYVVVPPESDAAAAAKTEKRDAAIAAKVKRDIDGFRAALQFARDAQLTQPRIELGFGITQNAGVNVPANSAANGALPPGQTTRPGQEKRDVGEAEDKLGMTLIAIGEI